MKKINNFINNSKGLFTMLLLSIAFFSSNAQTTTSLRSDGVMLLNGEPFFPIGYYAEGFNTLASINYAANSMAAAGFNMVFNEHDIEVSNAEFGSYLDNCASKGIYNIISFYDNSTAVDAKMSSFIPAFKNKPSVAVWGIADDSGIRGTEEEIIRKHNLATLLDPNHITFQATNAGIIKEGPVSKVGMSGTQVYNIFNPNDNRLDGYQGWEYITKCVNKCTTNSKVPFGIPQAFINGSTFPNTQGYTFPTAAQCDAQSYFNIVAGMKGLIFYTFQDYYGSTINVSQPDYWNASSRVANEIQGTLKNVILNGTRTTVADQINHIYYSKWLYNNETYIIAVNVDLVSHAISIPVNGNTLTKVFSYRNGNMSLSNNNLSGNLNSLDVQIYKINSGGSSTVAVTGISLNSGSATILVNGTQQLDAVVAPADATNKNVSWTSSNTAVASVNNTGLVTGIAAGNATITATTQDGNKTATSQITVNPLLPTPGLLLINPGFEDGLSSGWTNDWSGNSIITTQIKNSGVNALQLGSQSGGRAQRITAGFTAGNQYILSAWARLSSAGSVGNIGVLCENSSGVQLGNFYAPDITNFDAFLNKSVTFTVPAGTTSMEVYAYYDGSSSGKLYVDDFNLVTTAPSTVSITGISLNSGSATILVNGTQQLNATVAPANATNKNVSWTSSNTAVASVNNTGLVTGIAAGNATITATTQDGNKTATSQITVNPLSPTPGLLLINPGFEDGLSSGWTNDWSGNSIITTQIKNSGVNALQLGSQSGGRAQRITAGFTAGNEYVLSAWARLSSAGSVGYIGVLCENSSGVQLGNFYASDITNFDAFLNKSLTFTVPAGTTSMEVYAYYDGSSSGKLYVDDFNLVTTAPSTVSVTGISLNSGSATISVNGTQQLNATVAPANATNKNVSWSSSNTAVASVNNTGLVTGIAAGNATITATTQDGNKTATSQITVNRLVVTPGLLLINPGFENGLSSGWTSDWGGNSIITTQIKNSGVNALQLGSQSGGRAQRITAGFTAGNQYTLSAWVRLSSAGSVGYIGVLCENSSGVQLGNFYASDIINFDAFINKSVTFTVPAGTTLIQVYAYYNGSSSSKLYVDDFTLVAATSAAVSNKNSENNDNFKVDVYPNPVVSNLNLAYNLKTAGNVTFQINNSYGNQIKQFSSKAKVAGEQTFNMDVSDLKNGIYFIRITNSDGEQVIKKILVDNK